MFIASLLIVLIVILCTRRIILFELSLFAFITPVDIFLFVLKNYDHAEFVIYNNSLPEAVLLNWKQLHVNYFPETNELHLINQLQYFDKETSMWIT